MPQRVMVAAEVAVLVVDGGGATATQRLERVIPEEGSDAPFEGAPGVVPQPAPRAAGGERSSLAGFLTRTSSFFFSQSFSSLAPLEQHTHTHSPLQPPPASKFKFAHGTRTALSVAVAAAAAAVAALHWPHTLALPLLAHSLRQVPLGEGDTGGGRECLLRKRTNSRKR